MKFKEFIFEKLDSTQEFAKKNIDVLPTFSLIEALEQTKGRTRKRNIKWFSKKGEGIYITFILPKPKIQPLSLFSLSFSLQVVKTFNNYFNIPLKIKWPNDIYLNGKKLAGILSEFYKERFLLGIGINLYQRDFPLELKHKATSLLKEGYSLEKKKVKEILRYTILKTFENPFFDKMEYEKYLILKGKIVKVKSFSRLIEGYVLGISQTGELIIKNDKGIFKILEGEVIYWE